MITTEDRENIDEVLDQFNFDKINKVMNFLEWKWVTEYGFMVPGVYELRKQARSLLENVTKKLGEGDEEFFIGTGGFNAHGRRYAGDPRKYLTLTFYIDEKRSWYD